MVVYSVVGHTYTLTHIVVYWGVMGHTYTLPCMGVYWGVMGYTYTLPCMVVYWGVMGYTYTLPCMVWHLYWWYGNLLILCTTIDNSYILTVIRTSFFYFE